MDLAFDALDNVSKAIALPLFVGMVKQATYVMADENTCSLPEGPQFQSIFKAMTTKMYPYYTTPGAEYKCHFPRAAVLSFDPEVRDPVHQESAFMLAVTCKGMSSKDFAMLMSTHEHEEDWEASFPVFPSLNSPTKGFPFAHNVKQKLDIETLPNYCHFLANLTLPRKEDGTFDLSTHARPLHFTMTPSITAEMVMEEVGCAPPHMLRVPSLASEIPLHCPIVIARGCCNGHAEGGSRT